MPLFRSLGLAHTSHALLRFPALFLHVVWHLRTHQSNTVHCQVQNAHDLFHTVLSALLWTSASGNDKVQIPSKEQAKQSQDHSRSLSNSASFSTFRISALCLKPSTVKMVGRQRLSPTQTQGLCKTILKPNLECHHQDTNSLGDRC